MNPTTALLSGAILLVGAAAPAAGNDSMAAFGLGGLTLTRSDAIRMDSEDLYVSENRIRVDYVFTNTSGRDIETLVAFPLPDVENGYETPAYDFAGELDFQTTVDGRPMRLDLVQSASFKGVDVTGRLAGLGLPLMPVGDFDTRVNALPAAERDRLVADGLIEGGGSDGTQELWTAFWTVRTSVTRRQVFPAGRSIAVSHSYKPFVGGSVGGRLDASARREPEFAEARRKYCIDADFLKGLDRRIGGGTAGGGAYSETWISYVLTSGANWQGPIGTFRMTVDKGDPKALVSFCAQGVRKIDATRFEVTYRNFVPRGDVDVLIVKF